VTPPRILLVALALLVAALGAPSAARGHTGAGVATDYRIHLDGVRPQAPGAALHVYGGDDRIGLTWRGVGDLVVLGYAGEPYLRVGPGGAYENRRSPSVAANETRYGTVTAEPGVDPRAPPAWRRVSSSPTVVWHDHRSHWMSRTPSAAVGADPDRGRVVQRVSIPVRVDGRSARIVGRLDYLPPPRSAAWIGGILALGLLGAAGTAAGERIGRATARATALAAAGAGTAAAVCEWLAAPSSGLTSGAGGAPPAVRVALWIGAFAAALVLWGLAVRRGRAPEAVVLLAGAWLIGGGAALGRLGYLTHAFVPSVVPSEVARAMVALALAGLAAPAVWAWRVLSGVREAGRAGADRAPGGARAGAIR
jgi:hypothetical protein